MKWTRLVGLVGVAACAVDAIGAVNVFDLNSNPAVSISTSAHPSGATNVSVTLLGSASSGGIVFIETTVNDALGIVVLKNQSANHPLDVSIRGAGGQLVKRPASILEVRGGDGADNANEIRIKQCSVVGDVALLIDINSIENLVCGGDVQGIEIDAATHQGAAAPLFQQSTIDGGINVINLIGEDGLISQVFVKDFVGSGLGGAVLKADHIRNFSAESFSGLVTGYSGQYVKTIHGFYIVTRNGVGGDFAGSMWVDQLVADGGAPGEIQIDDRLISESRILVRSAIDLGQGEISIGAGGLRGRVVVGADGSTGDWTGPIRVGAITLGPKYDELASALGGGRAGVVPFDPHLLESTPEFGENFAFSTGAASPDYAISHYGWVTHNDGLANGRPVRVERRARCIGQDWLDVTDEWSFDYTSGGHLLLMSAEAAAHYRNGFEYRFVAQTDPEAPDALRCNLEGVVHPPVVAPYPSDPWFSVGSECPWDANGDSTIDVEDLNAVLGVWSGSGNNLYGDINGDGVVNVDDLNHVLSHWNETSCAGCGGESLLMMGGGENSFAAQSLDAEGDSGAGALMAEVGFGSVDEFCAALDGMNPAEQDAMLAALAEAAE